MGSENRKRNKNVHIRLSDDEFEQLRKKAGYVSLTVPGLLRELAIHQKIRQPQSPLIDRDGAFSIADELRAIGTNINQLAKKANQGAQVIGLEGVQRELGRFWQLLSSKLPR
ncbi:plasmid mobilization protein [Paenibacillus humicola]|uniref:plasmid mobilization protein n=1 Tax=Paenibacillus humicola TaxID=3110540 RepID=UPI00237ACC4E|nr:plasmid mobilization relaxosome protein MobC [Paenibacillus humicola]